MRKVLSYLRRAVQDYNLICNGDKIAVGISGGKDSMVLLAGLNAFKKHFDIEFEIVAVTLALGFEGSDFSKIADFCKRENIEYIIKETEIGKIVFDYRKEKSPCSLCSKMRRGALNELAREIGCNKVALGHNFDDIVETVYLNLFYEGRFGCFSPISFLDRVGITVIRPLIYMEESQIYSATKRLNIPVTPSMCPANENTKREYIKQHILSLKKDHPDIKNKIFSALCKAELNGWKNK